jgi:hypothetical protein
MAAAASAVLDAVIVRLAGELHGSMHITVLDDGNIDFSPKPSATEDTGQHQGGSSCSQSQPSPTALATTFLHHVRPN